MGQIQFGYHAHFFCWFLRYGGTAELPMSNSQRVSDWLRVQVCHGMSNDMEVGIKHSAGVCVCRCVCMYECMYVYLYVRMYV